MGPRPDGRGKSAPVRPASGHTCMRQWGRGQTAAERYTGAPAESRGRCVNGAAARRPRKVQFGRVCRGHHLASMGPRPDGRGKAAKRRASAAPLPRQWGRGQTAAESRLSPRRPDTVCCVNGAAARRPRKALGFLLGRSVYRCVNGAAARRPRKAVRARHLFTKVVASMGPRPDGRGKLNSGFWLDDAIRRVNGAAARRPRKARRRTPSARYYCRVNGAAARRPRKDGARRGRVRDRGASMGPRPDGRGKVAAGGGDGAGGSRVNGAAARRPRKGGLWRGGGRRTGCVNGAAARRPRKDSMPVAEWEQVNKGVNGAAARRPRKAGGGGLIARVRQASMGPRPDGRGKDDTPDLPDMPGDSVNGAAARRPRKAAHEFETIERLHSRQWGRGQTAAESSRRAMAPSIVLERQWGRGQTAAESG